MSNIFLFNFIDKRSYDTDDVDNRGGMCHLLSMIHSIDCAKLSSMMHI